jgi:hypothetical protein
MNIAVFSFKDIDVSDGVSELINKYRENNPTILLPILRTDDKFSQSVIRTAIDLGVKVNCYFVSAVGLDHILKQADDITLAENPVKEVLRQLKQGDSVGMVWDDSSSCHYILHATEDLALDTWDVTDGLDTIENDDWDFDLDEESLHNEMISTMGKFVDLMCAFVANTVMQSLSEAVAQHIALADEDGDIKDVNPFDDEE